MTIVFNYNIYFCFSCIFYQSSYNLKRLSFWELNYMNFYSMIVTKWLLLLSEFNIIWIYLLNKRYVPFINQIYLFLTVRTKNIPNNFFPYFLVSKHSNLWKFLLFPFLDDLSYNKIATQSPIYRRISEYEANNALDRNITTCMRTQAIGLSSTDNNMWWKVDLGGLYNVYRITIMFKSYEEQPGIYALVNVYMYMYLVCNPTFKY